MRFGVDLKRLSGLEIRCTSCGMRLFVPAEEIVALRKLRRCPVCGEEYLSSCLEDLSRLREVIQALKTCEKQFSVRLVEERDESAAS